MGKKLVLIGAGSAMFTQGLVLDLIKTHGKEHWKIALVDTNLKTLKSIYIICQKMIAEKGGNIELTAAVDRCDVLPGADYVVTTVGVGGRRAWEKDVIIPRKYGVFQPVGDSVMPGGISRAMRMIPAMIEITQDVMRLCPNAYFFNYANPMTMICRAVQKATGFPMVGLCHGVFQSEYSLADFAGLEREKFTSYAIGVNHLTFMYDFRYDGQDAIPLLLQKYKELYQQEGGDLTEVGASFLEMGEKAPKASKASKIKDPFAWSLFEQLRAYPAPGDRHITEYFAERFPNGNYYGRTLGIDAYSFENTILFGDKIYNRMDEMARTEGPLPADFYDNVVGEHEQLTRMIESIEHDKRTVFSVNMTNNGAVPNLPKDALLELPAAATARGFCPLQMNDFPDTLAQLLAKPIAIAELTVDAALKGDRNLYVEAILLGGYLNDRDAVRNMVNELIEAHMEYLPQFR